MSLEKILEQVGKNAELESLREYNDDRYNVKVSSFHRKSAQLNFIIKVLDEILDAKEDSEGNIEVFIKKSALPETKEVE